MSSYKPGWSWRIVSMQVNRKNQEALLMDGPKMREKKENQRSNWRTMFVLCGMRRAFAQREDGDEQAMAVNWLLCPTKSTVLIFFRVANASNRTHYTPPRSTLLSILYFKCSHRLSSCSRQKPRAKLDTFSSCNSNIPSLNSVGFTSKIFFNSISIFLYPLPSFSPPGL